MTAINELQQRSAEIHDLSCVLSLLHWDQEVGLPERAVNDRARQLAIISRIAHQKTVDPALGKLLEQAEENKNSLPETDQALLRVLRREFTRNSRLPENFVADFSTLTSQSLQAWVEARRTNTFSNFQPFLEKIVCMCRQKAEYLGYADRPYDALLDLHEEGLTTATVANIFSELQPILSNLVQKTRAREWPQPALNKQTMRQEDQIRFSEHLLQSIGYDFSRGRQDKSAHPFSTTIGHHDRRITNRFNPQSFEFIFSALHEGGHALYEQGIADERAYSVLDDGISLGIHESQSRLWENIIGRSREFWEYAYPELEKAFPGMLSSAGLDGFVKAINTVKPGLIRVEADEVCYNLHVIIRFELEQGLMDGTVAVRDLPGLWNEMYNQSLGVTVDSDANGVLQDVHWSHGSLGYFPTYTIGNIASAQFWKAYCAADPAFGKTIASGNFTKIRNWLTENIYQHGSVYPPAALLHRVTGEPLTSTYFIDYLHSKFGEQGS